MAKTHGERLAVVETQVTEIKDDIKDMKTNHLPHIDAKLNSLDKKFISLDKKMYAGVAIITFLIPIIYFIIEKYIGG